MRTQQRGTRGGSAISFSELELPRLTSSSDSERRSSLTNAKILSELQESISRSRTKARAPLGKVSAQLQAVVHLLNQLPERKGDIQQLVKWEKALPEVIDLAFSNTARLDVSRDSVTNEYEWIGAVFGHIATMTAEATEYPIAAAVTRRAGLIHTLAGRYLQGLRLYHEKLLQPARADDPTRYHVQSETRQIFEDFAKALNVRSQLMVKDSFVRTFTADDALQLLRGYTDQSLAQLALHLRTETRKLVQLTKKLPANAPRPWEEALFEAPGQFADQSAKQAVSPEKLPGHYLLHALENIAIFRERLATCSEYIQRREEEITSAESASAFRKAAAAHISALTESKRDRNRQVALEQAYLASPDGDLLRSLVKTIDPTHSHLVAPELFEIVNRDGYSTVAASLSQLASEGIISDEVRANGLALIEENRDFAFEYELKEDLLMPLVEDDDLRREHSRNLSLREVERITTAAATAREVAALSAAEARLMIKQNPDLLLQPEEMMRAFQHFRRVLDAFS